MSDYVTSLETWGATGSVYPSGYNYVEGEQPVDDWDNFFAYNAIEDIDHLVSLTNNRIESGSGTAFPSSPESSHIFYREDEERLYSRNSTDAAWDGLMKVGGDTMTGVLDMGGYQITDSSGFLVLNGPVRGANDKLSIRTKYDHRIRIEEGYDGPGFRAVYGGTDKSRIHWNNAHGGWEVDDRLHVDEDLIVNGNQAIHRGNVAREIQYFLEKDTQTPLAGESTSATYNNFEGLVPHSLRVTSESVDAEASVVFDYTNGTTETFAVTDGTKQVSLFENANGIQIEAIEFHFDNSAGSTSNEMYCRVDGFTLS